MRRRSLILGLAALPLVACAPARPVWAPDDQVARARVPNLGATSLSLITVRSEAFDKAEHTALMIDASELAMFDPFGGWADPIVPERNDVLFGLSEPVRDRYLAYLTSFRFYYQRQQKACPPQVAEAAFARAKAYGAVGMAQCTRAVADVLHDLPGFEGLGRPWTPDGLQRRFARLDGVTFTEWHGGPAEALPA
jgi:hypothetical protein